MEQSKEANLRVIPSFWSNHIKEQPHFSTQWSDRIHLVIIATENMDTIVLADRRSRKLRFHSWSKQ